MVTERHFRFFHTHFLSKIVLTADEEHLIDFLSHVSPLKVRSSLNKKGQMKIQQMIFVIIAVTLLFVLVGMFFLSINLSNVKQTATNLAEENSMLLVSKLANSPEFSCGNSFGSSRTNCVDFDKIIALGKDTDYLNFWGVAKIEVRKIFPDEGNKLCDENNYPNCGIVNILDRNVKTLPYSSNFISLCRKETDGKIIYDKCELALLLIASEDKTQ